MPAIKLSMPDYRAHPAISKSGLDLIHRSPAHYMEDKLSPEKDTEALIFGRMFHTYLLEPELFDAQYAEWEGANRSTTAGKNAWGEWLLVNAGKEPVKPEHMEMLKGMRESVYGNPYAKNALTGGLVEMSLFWEVSGIQVKARPDYISPQGIIVDLKSTIDAQPKPFSRDCANHRYHVQNAVYTDGYFNVYGEYPKNFLIVAVEKTKPYAVALYTLQDMLDQGYREYAEDLRVYGECLATDTWPAYPTDARSLQLPGWAVEVG